MIPKALVAAILLFHLIGFSVLWGRKSTIQISFGMALHPAVLAGLLWWGGFWQ